MRPQIIIDVQLRQRLQSLPVGTDESLQVEAIAKADHVVLRLAADDDSGEAGLQPAMQRIEWHVEQAIQRGDEATVDQAYRELQRRSTDPNITPVQRKAWGRLLERITEHRRMALRDVVAARQRHDDSDGGIRL